MRLASSLVIAGVFTAVLGVLAPPASAAVVHLNSCGTLAAPGTYVLSKNLNAGFSGCFTIASNDVVLDLGGHTLTGQGQFGSGIDVPGGPDNALRTGVRIRNGGVGNFGSGIVAREAAGVVIENVSSSVNREDGIDAGIGAVLLNVRADQNGHMGIVTGAGSYVSHGTVGGNHSFGIDAVMGSVVLDTSASFNGFNGIAMTSKAFGTLRRNTVEGNTGNGILADCPAIILDNKGSSFFPNAFNNFMARQTDFLVPDNFFRSITCSTLQPGTKLTQSRLDDFPTR